MPTILPVRLQQHPEKLVLLDQTKLPVEEVFLYLDTRESIFEAIKKLRVRGAPAIGIAAAYGMYVCLSQNTYPSLDAMEQDMKALKEYFASSRPTAVNLFWALDRMEKTFHENLGKQGITQTQLLAALLQESNQIFLEDQAMGKSIGMHGLSLFDKKKQWGVMTHCNAGGLATSGYGTALAPLYLGHEQGYQFKVFSNETRPLLQGSRLTAYELAKGGIDVTILCDTMVSLVMKERKIDAVIVGADRIAANGDTANKIGTSGVAILARYYNIPFYVAAPSSTFDVATATGNDIIIEIRDGDEVVNGFGKRTGPKNVSVYNPAFDVTDATLITGIITEKGIIESPNAEKIKNHLSI
ncbi:MAG: methylthioribose-phosphate isomerase [Sphaerochaeta sp.]|jgi:methylthioribose-1-phosphate isomerase|uniref:Methylthioribose-1-phosphate isomerase n=1 Tax=Sphaerochaeta halotolerans TaxID=2293840 RepID=A0A372MEX9_9SPIR|nr:S-methyl-5-thioribose-1-phosphate isomerase [Sphaerochaeta halotolerans]MBG0766775.1 S-methyl-5-thioribose-1-phosphate isomerase [Spirochaetaceae bacterium]MDK2859738.1 methylthioribose-phosphate isomerase [Sphaerochaeta sp.]MDN5334209.1 methylthioribose-phosphate isomerase [Sphaerochaeta sp.]RFU94337.1 S-methyl-5-thioribose-1-phosphate isomerase [Sphaerochaeta halotolerans]